MMMMRLTRMVGVPVVMVTAIERRRGVAAPPVAPMLVDDMAVRHKPGEQHQRGEQWTVWFQTDEVFPLHARAVKGILPVRDAARRFSVCRT